MYFGSRMTCPTESGCYENLEFEPRDHCGNGQDEAVGNNYTFLHPANEGNDISPKQKHLEQNGNHEDYCCLHVVTERGQPSGVNQVEPADSADYEDYRQINSVVVQSCEENVCDTVQHEQEFTTSPETSAKLKNYKHWFRLLFVAFCILCVSILGSWIAISVVFNHSDRSDEELNLQAERRDGRVSSALAFINQTIHEKVTANGNWSNWDSWNSCSETCGVGLRSRRRQCINPEPEFGGVSCDGDNLEYQSCESRSCAVNGNWSNWDIWNSCSQTCGVGIRRRRRQCTNPEPAFGGISCDGDNMEYQRCQSRSCAVNGSWSNWDNWNSCSRTCGVGIHSRRRQCTNPEPAFGGISCDGDNMEYQTCESRSCGVNGSWSNWNSWNSCSQTCGVGIRSRRRQCTNPAPAFGGISCDGDNVEYQTCESASCAVNGGWGAWNSWDTCSTTCASGLRTRTRSCNFPTPQFGGRYCDGSSQQFKTCWMGSCLS